MCEHPSPGAGETGENTCEVGFSEAGGTKPNTGGRLRHDLRPKREAEVS